MATAGAEARRRYPSPDDFAEAAAHTRIFSYESMGVTNAGAPLSARRRTDGKIQVHLTVRSFGNDYREDALTLYGQDYVLEPEEEVGVRLYDEGGGALDGLAHRGGGGGGVVRLHRGGERGFIASGLRGKMDRGRWPAQAVASARAASAPLERTPGSAAVPVRRSPGAHFFPP